MPYHHNNTNFVFWDVLIFQYAHHSPKYGFPLQQCSFNGRGMCIFQYVPFLLSTDSKRDDDNEMGTETKRVIRIEVFMKNKHTPE